MSPCVEAYMANVSSGIFFDLRCESVTLSVVTGSVTSSVVTHHEYTLLTWYTILSWGDFPLYNKKNLPIQQVMPFDVTSLLKTFPSTAFFASLNRLLCSVGLVSELAINNSATLVVSRKCMDLNFCHTNGTLNKWPHQWGGRNIELMQPLKQLVLLLLLLLRAFSKPTAMNHACI